MARMTLAQAAEAWIKAKREERKIRAQLEASSEILKQHFRETGRSDYKGQISYAKTVRRLLDTAAVKAELGDRLPKFQKDVPVETLSLLQ